MVFITLGTQGNQFPRCLQMVEELIDMLHPGHEFIAQIGNTEYKSNKIKVLEYVSETEFKRLIGEADVVITHAGSGSLFNAIKQGKKTIAVARLKKYKEMLNDHQTELVKNFQMMVIFLMVLIPLLMLGRNLNSFNRDHAILSVHYHRK